MEKLDTLYKPWKAQMERKYTAEQNPLIKELIRKDIQEMEQFILTLKQPKK